MRAIELGQKGSVQVCGVGPDGRVVFHRARSRPRLRALLAEGPAGVGATEARATSHHGGRVAPAHGHEGRLVPAACARPDVDA